MKKILVLIALLVASTASAQTTVNQGTASPTTQKGWRVQGNSPDGSSSTIVGNPVIVGGSDGSLVHVVATDSSGRPLISGAAADDAAAAGNPVTVAGVDGSGNTQTVATETNGQVRVTTYSSGGVEMGTTTNPVLVTNRPGFVKTGAPTANVSASAVSAAATGLTASACYRVSCGATVFFRTGTGTPTAVTTDNPFYGPAVEKICIPSTDTAVAFIMSAGTTTCSLTLLSNTP